MPLSVTVESPLGVRSENISYVGGGCADIGGHGHRGAGEQEREAGMGGLKGDMAKTG